MRMPRLIATDLDGTFLNPAGRYDHDRFDRLLDQYQQRGGHFVVATGDPLSHVQDLFGGLANAAVLTYVVEDGALMTTSTGQVLQVHEIPGPLWRQAMAWLQTAPSMVNPFLIVCGRERAYTQLAASGERFNASRQFYPHLTHVDDLSIVQEPILKLDVTWLKADVLPQVAAFNREFAGRLVATSSGLGGMNVTLPQVSKATAVQAIAANWQIPASQVAAFGDSGNDLALLQWAGQGIAMANAAPEVRQAVPQHTRTTNALPAVLDTFASWLAAFEQ